MTDNLINNQSGLYLNFIKITIKNEYSFRITILRDLPTQELYVIIYSYLKNKNLTIKYVNAIRYKTLGIEYINLINIINFNYYDFLMFKNEVLSEDNMYYDSNFLFDGNINPQQPLEIEITTFNKNNITTNTKPKKINLLGVV